ncbi:MarC family NAAT transporter [Orrella sp. 11846]|uniref:MarC family NAAT transporter n=1 Tax=Orrella sp. 11846 TaxID=3409913 RepID=UPI003B59EE1E
MESIVQFFHLILIGFVMMLPLANPLTSMSLLLALGKDLSNFERKKQVRQAAIYVVGIMLVTYYAGSFVLSAFSISLPGMRIAGGLIVAYIGFKMLFPSTTLSDIPEAQQVEEDGQAVKRIVPNLAFVPLAMPGTAGPGTMALIMSAASQIQASQHHYAAWVILLVPVVVAGLLGLLFYVCLRSADRIVAMVGQDAVEAVARIMGFLLVCMAVQFVIDGVLTISSHPELYVK